MNGSAAPKWFHDALARPPQRTMVEVEGAEIETLSWGEGGTQGLLFLHGSRASAEWWTFVAPMLTPDFRVTAFSMSGMGRSDRRVQYSNSQYGREAIAVAESTGLFDCPTKPIIIAHSFGGYAALCAGRDYGDRIGGVVLVDSLIANLDKPQQPWARRALGPRRSFATPEAGMARFRLVPEQDVICSWAFDYIARSSVSHDPAAGDWTWHFDHALFSRLANEEIGDLGQVTVPLAIVRGEESKLLSLAARDYFARVFGDDVPDIVVPGAGHHIMIDQPLALVAALRALLASWPPATPRRRSRLGMQSATALG